MTAVAHSSEKAQEQVAFFTRADQMPASKKGYYYAKQDGTQAYRMTKVAVFRSGTFRDSWGDEHVYDPFHMESIANNFGLLSSSGAFPDPPIRCNHPSLFSGGLESVVGYVQALYTEEAVSPADGQTYTYLFADYDVLDAEASKKIDSGLWRHRSAEIGFYQTNGNLEFWPVLLGFAYVDIPAVEGLNGNFSKYANNLPGVGEKFVAVAEDKESGQVTDTNKNSGNQTDGAPAPAANPVPPVPAAPVTPAQATATQVFSIGGRQTSDFAAVQAYIVKLESDNTELEAFQSQAISAGRKAFVDSLATGPNPRLFANQAAKFKDLVVTMTDEQYNMFKSTYEDAPVVPTLGEHAVADETFGKNVSTSSGPVAETELDKNKRVYNRLKLMGTLSKEQLAESPSGKFLIAAGEKL